MSEKTDKGRITIWRKIEDSWQWQEPLTRSAWLWMLLKAAYKPHNGLKRGELYFSLAWAKKRWGMSPMTAKRFLDRCTKEGDITWTKGRGGINTQQSYIDAPVKECDNRGDTQSGSQSGSQLSILTLLHYNEYNLPRPYGGSQLGSQNDSSSDSGGDRLLEEKVKKERKEVQDPPKRGSPVTSVPGGSKKSPSTKTSKSKKETKADPRVKELTDFFFRQYDLWIGGKYVVAGGKDTSAIKRLLSSLDEKEVKKRMCRYLEDPDPFLVKQGHNIATFAQRVNGYSDQNYRQQKQGAKASANFRRKRIDDMLSRVTDES